MGVLKELEIMFDLALRTTDENTGRRLAELIHNRAEAMARRTDDAGYHLYHAISHVFFIGQRDLTHIVDALSRGLDAVKDKDLAGRLHSLRASAHLDLCNYDEALQDIQAAPDGLHLNAAMLFAQGKWPEAEEVAHQVILADSVGYAASITRLQLAWKRVNVDRNPEAGLEYLAKVKEWLDNAPEIYRRDVQALFHVLDNTTAWAYISLGRKDEAFHLFDSVASDTPKNPEYLADFAFALDRLQQDRKAAARQRQAALSLIPPSAGRTYQDYAAAAVLFSCFQDPRAGEIYMEGLAKGARSLEAVANLPVLQR